jgi:hypothetical protein
MKYLIKNNKYNELGPFAGASISEIYDMRRRELKRIADILGIGMQIKRKRTTQKRVKGILIDQTVDEIVDKPLQVIRDEIIKDLTVHIKIPKEFWTEEQRDVWERYSVVDIEDITREREILEDANIWIELPPFSDDPPTRRYESLMLAEVNDTAWEYINQKYNVYILNNNEGTDEPADWTERKKTTIAIVEEIPETADEKARAAKEANVDKKVKKAQKKSK